MWVSDKRELESTRAARESVPREIPAVGQRVCSHTCAPSRDCHTRSICNFRDHYHLVFFRDYTKPRERCVFLDLLQ